MQTGSRLTAFVPSTDLARSEAFYATVLGLPVRELTPYALVLDGLGTELRVTLVTERAAADYTVLGWVVDDLDESVRDLVARGVRFLRYDGMDQDDLGGWRSPSGARIAWFSDPDGNTLSLQQPAPSLQQPAPN